MTQDMEGRIAFVTGGASGIGKAAARLFADRGARVAIVDRDAGAALSLAEELRGAGRQAIGIGADVSSEENVESAIAETIAALGGLDYAFNNAGIGSEGVTFEDATFEKWSQVIAINLSAVFLCMKHQLRHMANARYGAIVNTSSAAGFTPAPLGPAYTAAKHGVLGLTKVAAKEFASRGIRVNAVCPGLIETPMARAFIPPGSEMERQMIAVMPSQRLGSPSEVAEAAVWLCSDAASFVSGESMVIDGGSLCR